ncbi:MAG: hypothetical protein R3F19_00695 [Verrucomicrobiales bacterium]
MPRSTTNRRRATRKAPAKRKTAGGASNRRASPRDRKDKREKLMARHAAKAKAAFAPIEIPVTWVKNVAGVLMLPLCVVSTITFFSSFASAALEGAFWKTPEFWFFNLGMILWIIAFWGLPRPVRVYVFGHEMTHALFVYLCGGRVEEFKVTPEGGHVVTDKNNLLISLSPYFVPFYTVIAVLAFVLIGAFFDLSHYHEGVFFGIGGFKWAWLMFGIIGLTWGFHFSFTGWMILKDQPDLRSNGTFFSLMLIYLINILMISGLLVVASPSVQAGEFVHQWLDTARSGTHWLLMKAHLR